MRRSARDAKSSLLSLRLTDKDPRVRSEALKALSTIGGPKAGELLLEALRDGPDADAARGLEDLSWRLKRNGQEEQREALAKQAVPVMIEYLKQGQLLKVLPQSLGKFGPYARDAVPVLHDLLRSTEEMQVKGQVPLRSRAHGFLFARRRSRHHSVHVYKEVPFCFRVLAQEHSLRHGHSTGQDRQRREGR